MNYVCKGTCIHIYIYMYRERERYTLFAPQARDYIVLLLFLRRRREHICVFAIRLRRRHQQLYLLMVFVAPQAPQNKDLGGRKPQNSDYANPIGGRFINFGNELLNLFTWTFYWGSVY